MNCANFSTSFTSARSLAVIVIATWAATPLLAIEPWLQFRGPQSAGVASSDHVTFTLDTNTHLLWRSESVVTGWSSPITDGHLLWVTSAKTIEATPEQRAAKLVGAKFAANKEIVSNVELFATCINAETGMVLHDIKLASIASPNSINPMNSFASPTGAWAGDKVVLHFGRYGTFCLDSQSGEELWRTALVIDDSMGPGSSVVEHNGVIVVPCDGMDKQFVAGLSLESGEEVWRRKRPEIDAKHGEFRKSYSTPLLLNSDGLTQAVVPGAQWCVAYEPSTGRELWKVRHGSGFSISPTPVYSDGKVIYSSGYGEKELIAVDPSGSGDVTDTHVLWKTQKGAPVMPSVAVVDGLIYSITESGVLTALDINDGGVVWQKRVGGKYSASPLVSGRRIIIANHAGTVTVFRAGRTYEEIEQYEVGEQIMASPVPIGDDLILRTASSIYRFSSPNGNSQ